MIQLSIFIRFFAVIIVCTFGLNRLNYEYKMNQYHRINSHLVTKQQYLTRIHNQNNSETKIYYKNNLNVMNWYYGTIKPEDYRIKLFEITTKYNLTSCPMSTPFVKQSDNTRCFNCVGDLPIYNIGKNQCQACPTNLKYDTVLGNCTADTSNSTNTGNATNTTTNASNTISTTNTTNTTNTSDQTKGTNTDNTTSTNNTNNTKNTTNTTTNNQSTNVTTTNSTNITIPTNNPSNNTNNSSTVTNKTDTSNSTNSANVTKSLNQSINCPPQKPILKDNVCSTCLENQEYLNDTKKCQKKIYKVAENAKRVILSDPQQLKKQAIKIQSQNPKRTIYDCPNQKPYLLGKQCLYCNKYGYYDYNKQQCVNDCPQYTSYNQKTRLCVKIYYLTQPNSTNLIANVIKFQQFQKNTQKQLKEKPFAKYCPSTAPYSVNGKCIYCPSGKKYFDLDLLECVGCQDWREYDEKSHQCVSNYTPSVSLDRMIINII